MAILANSLIQIQMVGTCFGQRIIFTHWLRPSAAAPAVNNYTQDLNLILNQIAAGTPDDMVTPYVACLPQQYIFSYISAQAITPVRSVKVQRVPVPGITGTYPDDATVANDAAVITFRTDLGGRKQISNRHMGPAPDDVSDQGVLVPAYKTVLTTFATSLLDAVTPVGWIGNLDPVVPHLPGGTADDIKSFVIQETSRVMRRRTVRVGE